MKIVTFSGGNGGYRLLSGLKKKDVDITAIISCFDSGGSTGRLREEFGGIALGDIRRGFLALTPDEKGFATMKKLLKKRFDEKTSLNGHSLGNLLLLSMGIQKDPESLKEAWELFGLGGRYKIIPPSFSESHLCAELEDGTVINGETNIDVPKHDPSLRINKVFLNPKAKAYCEALREIKEADAIIIGPGDLYTSIMQSFLVEGISEAVKESGAKKLFVLNTMTKIGETEKYKASDFANELEKYAGFRPDWMIINSSSNQSTARVDGSHNCPVECDRKILESMGIKVLEEDVVCDEFCDLHDPDKLADTITEVLKCGQ